MNKPLAFLLSVIVIGAGIYFWTQLEYYEEEVDLGQSLTAYLNDYLAAEQFLRAQGHEVEGNYQLELSTALPQDATLFISNANHVLDERRAASLADWIKAGGHVIIAAHVLTEGDDDVFLKEFGVEKYSYETDLFPDDGDWDNEEENQDDEKTLADSLRESRRLAEEEEQKRKDREQAQEEGRLDTVAEELTYEEEQFFDSDLAYLDFEGIEQDVRILADVDEYLDHPSFYSDDSYEGYSPFYWDGSDRGVNFMQFNVEEGLLTVVGDGTIWNNQNIGLFEHAYLLQVLTQHTEKVVFLRGAIVPGFFEMIWTNFRELTVVLALLLLLWLVYRGRRFGPVLDASDRGRRSYREHLSAVGDFYWRHKQRDELLQQARDAIWREFNKKHFAASNDSEKEKIERLSILTDYDRSYLESALNGAAPQDEYKFLYLIQSLQQIRKKL